MEYAVKLIAIVVSAALVDNFVLAKFMGICPFLGVSKKFNTAFGMSMAVTAVMLLATMFTWPIQHYILNPFGLGYMQTIVFILVIAGLVQLLEMLLKKYIPKLYKSLGIFLPLITTNCAVLGVTILNIDEGYGFVESLCNALGGGIGFMIALIIFSGVRERINRNDIPEFLKGLPITLVAASIASISFMGFAGLFG